MTSVQNLEAAEFSDQVGVAPQLSPEVSLKPSTRENKISILLAIKIMIEGQPVFLCCQGCKKRALANAKASLSKAATLKAESTKR